MYKFALEKFDDALSEMLPLFKKHQAEVSEHQDIPLVIDVERYQRIQEAGLLKIFTARDEDSKELIGYAVFFVLPHAHHMTSLTAQQDVVYIKPSRRGFGTGFLARCDEELREAGVQIVYHHVKVEHDWSKLLIKLGYQHVEQLYSRRLDKES